MIPLTRPALPDLAEIQPDLRTIWNSGQVTLGGYTRQFETEAAAFLGVPEAIAVSSCTAGLMLSLKALGLQGEVIVPSFTFAATVHAIAWNRLTPVFCDVDPRTATLDPVAAERLLTNQTCAILPVYAYGNPPDHDALEALARRGGLALVFDAAQGLGSSYKGRRTGGFGDVEVFSLSPTKVITSLEGGLVTTRRANLAQRIRQMRDYGKSADEAEGMSWVGLSARMSEVHALIGLMNLRRAPALIIRRIELIRRYQRLLEGIPGVSFPTAPAGALTSGNFMPVFIDEREAKCSRDDLQARLKERQIETKRHFFPPAHHTKAYRQSDSRWQLPVTEKLAREALLLPLYDRLTESEMLEVCEAVGDVLSEGSTREGIALNR